MLSEWDKDEERPQNEYKKQQQQQNTSIKNNFHWKCT